MGRVHQPREQTKFLDGYFLRCPFPPIRFDPLPSRKIGSFFPSRKKRRRGGEKERREEKRRRLVKVAGPIYLSREGKEA